MRPYRLPCRGAETGLPEPQSGQRTHPVPPNGRKGKSAREKGWHPGPRTLTSPASLARPPGDAATEAQQMGGAETQASRAAPPSPPLLPTHPRPPAPGHRGGSRAGAGGRGGRSEGGRGRREPGWEGGGGVGREKKKENIFRVPACRVSVRFGRKCVGYFGAVTWAGGLREAPGPSQPRVRAPRPRAPHHREPLPLRRSILATARRRDLGARRPPFPLPPPPGESGGEAGSAPRTDARVPRRAWAGGGGAGEPRRLRPSPGWSGCPHGWRGADLGVSPDVGREWGRF